MINEKYIRSLNRLEGKSGMIVYWCTLLVPLFFIVMGVLNTWQAMRIPGAGDFTFGDYLSSLLEEIDVKSEYKYSGLYLLGLGRFHTALLHFTFAIVMTPLALGVNFEKRRNRAISNALKKHGEI